MSPNLSIVGGKLYFDEGPLIYVSGAVCWIMMIRIEKFG